eukprot:m.178575 g.178575  ORF g.178575 m.178575 type:complete len:96 (-) comp16591_c1_seq1:239-526(-)
MERDVVSDHLGLSTCSCSADSLLHRVYDVDFHLVRYLYSFPCSSLLVDLVLCSYPYPYPYSYLYLYLYLDCDLCRYRFSLLCFCVVDLFPLVVHP